MGGRACQKSSQEIDFFKSINYKVEFFFHCPTSRPFQKIIDSKHMKSQGSLGELDEQTKSSREKICAEKNANAANLFENMIFRSNADKDNDILIKYLL